jgi:hypothetical protein
MVQRQRQNLQTLLEELQGNDHVYFQPAENVQMEYPCIVYQRDNRDTKFADNAPYKGTQRYQITVIDRDPDSAVALKLTQWPLCRFDRFYVAENLNHDVFTLYF